MSDSSEDECSSDWIPYSERIEWADVKPIPQYDGSNPIVAIAYSSNFRDVYDYFRAIVASNEKSERALNLTKDAVRLNPANYTVWQYRREILKSLNADLSEELDYVADFIRENSKNYQVWHHRRVIVELLNDASKELELTQTTLRTDAKNYHAWQHRQWAIKTFDLFDDELAFVDRLIAEDIRNNSAWNQRFFIVKHYGFTPEVIQRELTYAMNRIRVVKNNESAWNYLVGVVKEAGDDSYTQYPDIVRFAEELYENNVRSPYLLAFLIDMYSEKTLNSEIPVDRQEFSQKVFHLCDEMAKKHDVIRRKYWQYIADHFKAQLDESAK